MLTLRGYTAHRAQASLPGAGHCQGAENRFLKAIQLIKPVKNSSCRIVLYVAGAMFYRVCVYHSFQRGCMGLLLVSPGSGPEKVEWD